MSATGITYHASQKETHWGQREGYNNYSGVNCTRIHYQCVRCRSLAQCILHFPLGSSPFGSFTKVNWRCCIQIGVPCWFTPPEKSWYRWVLMWKGTKYKPLYTIHWCILSFGRSQIKPEWIFLDKYIQLEPRKHTITVQQSILPTLFQNQLFKDNMCMYLGLRRQED